MAPRTFSAWIIKHSHSISHDQVVLMASYMIDVPITEKHPSVHVSGNLVLTGLL